MGVAAAHHLIQRIPDNLEHQGHLLPGNPDLQILQVLEPNSLVLGQQFAIPLSLLPEPLNTPDPTFIQFLGLRTADPPHPRQFLQPLVLLGFLQLFEFADVAGPQQLLDLR